MQFLNRITRPIGVIRNLHRQFSENPITRQDLPGAWWRLIRWQTIDRLSGAPRLTPLANGLMLRARHGVTASTGVLYMGLPEVESMSFVAHALREGDSFVDVGANIGTFSVLAAGLARCSVVAIEPIPATHQMLVENLRLNGLLGYVQAMNVAVGDKHGIVRMTQSNDATNHVLHPDSPDGVPVPCQPLDDLALPTKTTFMKVDIEGYEFKAILGAQRILRHPLLAGILMEFGCGAYHGVDEGKLYQSMLDFGFQSCGYDPLTRELRPLAGGPGRPGNTIFVRDVASTQTRLRAGPELRVLGARL